MSFVSQFPLTTLTALTTIAQYQIFSLGIGLGRVSQDFPNTRTLSNEEFEDGYRVYINSLSSITVYLASLFLFAQLSGQDKVTAGLGGIYLLGRLWLLFSHVKNPKATKAGSPGAMLGYLVQTAWFHLHDWSGIVEKVNKM